MALTPSNSNLPAVLEGEISVLAALQSRSRKIQRVIISNDIAGDEVRDLEQAARIAAIRIERLTRAQIDVIAQGKTHGGVVAEVGERRFLSLDVLLTWKPTDVLTPNARALTHPPAPPPFIVMLDGIEDPFNFGQAVRALYAAGASGLVVRPRNWMSASAVVARASAGASEWMPTAISDTPHAAAAFFQQHGLRIAATARDRRAVSLYDADLTHPMFLVIGGEKRGISREFMEAADLLLKIPYRRKFPYSLGSAASASVIAFEMMRQGFASRGKEKE